mmetsp:Transcript_43249/g.92526  ORF Transcript_43249/g.92526 Transcript_43249/m.92526 type:complete len:563 (-) Transcript_43249:227-1915(-)|eukprot:CAMPEP_0206439100 /NCGR_PEP_ID=MMETSP0324_2-20121206/12015_1 /ASSEMBLY_ACC=CAM_ASM_000836 /TAXON_ID=2866 /ORGANISM="Crypthecodinium cohnii, Strain Seligo" /LENGTH=562 /DNA_ID=CAMNT_0053906667 /DNA_START=89 /DNA_END=1777 /DNA_ORIENTATION=+
MSSGTSESTLGAWENCEVPDPATPPTAATPRSTTQSDHGLLTRMSMDIANGDPVSMSVEAQQSAEKDRLLCRSRAAAATLCFAAITAGLILYWYYGFEDSRSKVEKERLRLAQCGTWATNIQRVRKSDDDVVGYSHCNEGLKAADIFESSMDPPLDESLVKTKIVKISPEWTVHRPCLPEEGCEQGEVEDREFGKAMWAYPASMEVQEDLDRILFVHGCQSDCSASGPEYRGMVDRLALHFGLPVLGYDFAAEPEHPWPAPTFSVLRALEAVRRSGPLSPKAARRVVIAADSEGALVALQVMAMLINETARVEFGVPEHIQSMALPGGEMPLAAIVLWSPTVDLKCTSASMDTNCYDDGSLDLTPKDGEKKRGHDCAFESNCTDTTAKERQDDCKWSYLQYFFGQEWMMDIKSTSDADAQYARHSQLFWENPMVNALHMDYSRPGVPAIFVVSGELDYFADDAVQLVMTICKSGGTVEHYIGEGMWHDFQEWSEGCGGGTPIPEAKAAYKKPAKWLRKLFHLEALSLNYEDGDSSHDDEHTASSSFFSPSIVSSIFNAHILV